jgi:hypothetical protein
MGQVLEAASSAMSWSVGRTLIFKFWELSEKRVQAKNGCEIDTRKIEVYLAFVVSRGSIRWRVGISLRSSIFASFLSGTIGLYCVLSV